MTVIAPTAVPAADADALSRRYTRSTRRSHFCRRQPLGTFGLVIVRGVRRVAGLSADWIAPYDPEENDFNAMMEAPSLAALAGHRPVRPGHLLRAWCSARAPR